MKTTALIVGLFLCIIGSSQNALRFATKIANDVDSNKQSNQVEDILSLMFYSNSRLNTIDDFGVFSPSAINDVRKYIDICTKRNPTISQEGSNLVIAILNEKDIDEDFSSLDRILTLPHPNYGKEFNKDNRQKEALNFAGKMIGLTDAAKPGNTGPAVLMTPLSATTVLIDSISGFLVERVKKELTIAFIDKFRNVVLSDSNFTALFPSVSMVIKYNDPLNFSMWINQVSLMAREDMRNLPMNVIPLLSKLPQQNSKSCQLAIKSLNTLTALIMKLQSGLSPYLAIKSVCMDMCFINKSVDSTLLFLNSLSECLFNPDTNRYLFLNEFNKQSFMEQRAFAMVFALSTKNILSSDVFKNNEKMRFSAIQYQVKNWQPIYLMYFANRFLEINQGIVQSVSLLENANSDKLKIRNAYKALNGYAFGIIELILDIKGNETETQNEATKKTLHNFCELSNFVIDENYRQAIVSLLTIIQPIMLENLDTSQVRDAAKVKIYYKNLSSINNIVVWAGFLAEISALDSAHEIMPIIRQYAAPVGSYRVKRNSLFSISVNSYPGICLGFGGNSVSMKFTGADYGITAPIGIGLNWAIRKWDNNAENKQVFRTNGKSDNKAGYFRGVQGLYFSIIDIGAPFVYRWSSDSAAGFPESIKWENVFAPGVFYSLGSKKSGFTVLFGAQLTPELRKITENGLTLKKDAFRLGINISYDIPLFTLYSKTVKRKLISR